MRRSADGLLPPYSTEAGAPEGEARQSAVLRDLLGCEFPELFFRIHLGLGTVKDGLLGDDASLDLRA